MLLQDSFLLGWVIHSRSIAFTRAGAWQQANKDASEEI